MYTQTYYHTKFEKDADRNTDTVPLQVNCVGAVSQNFSTRNVRQDYYYLYVLEGKICMEECTLFPGDVIVFEPGHMYQYKSEGEAAYLWAHYTGYEAYSLTKSTLHELNVKQHIGIREEIIDCFKNLFREFIINDEAATHLSGCILKEILFFTSRYVNAGDKTRVPLLAMKYIHHHFAENINIDQLAQIEHMSCTSLRNIFKRHTGISPNEYIIAQRISAACQLLSQTDQAVSEIAANVGYNDQYYFSRIFKKKVGIPPLQYRYSKDLHAAKLSYNKQQKNLR